MAEIDSPVTALAFLLILPPENVAVSPVPPIGCEIKATLVPAAVANIGLDVLSSRAEDLRGEETSIAEVRRWRANTV